MKDRKNLLIGFLLATCLILTIGATNVRDVGNSDNGRYEISSPSSNNKGYDYLLDTQTGEAWRIGKDKIPVDLKQK